MLFEFLAGILPMPLVFLLRRFQILSVDLDIHQGSIRRNETTASTKEMIDEDDVSTVFSFLSTILQFYLSFVEFLINNYYIYDGNIKFNISICPTEQIRTVYPDFAVSIVLFDFSFKNIFLKFLFYFSI